MSSTSVKSFWIFMLFLGCSDSLDNGTSSEASPSIAIQDSDLTDVYIIDWNAPDASPLSPERCAVATVQDENYCACNPDCCLTELWLCPPSGRDLSVYQREVIIEVCDENKIPCVWSEDANCPPPQILSTGECDQQFECDPRLNNTYLGRKRCETEEGNIGSQRILCNKGSIEIGECESCEQEVCDLIDNDCDDIVDENIGIAPCENNCGQGDGVCILGEIICLGPEAEEEICDHSDNDCDGNIDEGQLNACGECGIVSEDICDGIDNDCNGTVDRHRDGSPLIRGCETLCEQGIERCVNGEYTFCTAKQPDEESCNGLDDDCDNLVDEELTCSCPPILVAEPPILLPCTENPLICGSGFKHCECTDEDCTETRFTACKPICHYVENINEDCPEEIGSIAEESCNNWDDDCDEVTDENLFRECYDGPEGTLNVGICHAGNQTCNAGRWGVFSENEPELFVENVCGGQQLPLVDDICDGADNDCDGIIPEVLEPTDILFIIDTSGSMIEEARSVVQALNQFATFYSDQEVIRWGLILGPAGNGRMETLEIKQNLTSFQNFIANPWLLDPETYDTGSEMLYDALFLSAINLVPPVVRLGLPVQSIEWRDQNVGSRPPVDQFIINWREDANHVIILFSDEEPQTYARPRIDEENLQAVLNEAVNISVYIFSEQWHRNIMFGDSWGPVAVGGRWFPLTDDAAEMFGRLNEILDETACGENE